jgi:hypothetical protein
MMRWSFFESNSRSRIAGSSSAESTCTEGGFSVVILDLSLDVGVVFRLSLTGLNFLVFQLFLRFFNADGQNGLDL